jgi:hypothetical protein
VSALARQKKLSGERWLKGQLVEPYASQAGHERLARSNEWH